MKKHIITFGITLLLIIFVLVSCTLQQAENTMSNTSQMQISSTIVLADSALTNIYYSPTEENSRTNFISSAQPEATDNEKQKILKAVREINYAQLFYRFFLKAW